MKIHSVYLILVSLLIFLLPSNLFLKLFESTAYVNGVFVDYLIPKLYLSDLPILLILGTWLYENTQVLSHLRVGFLLNQAKKSLPNVFFSFILFTFITRQLFTPNPLAAVWYGLKLTEMLLLGVFLATHRSLLTDSRVHFAFLATVVFQSLLGIYQYLTQSALLGYWFLGEPHLSNPIGLAKITIQGVEKVLPYGTTAHPNILGGMMAIYCIILLRLQKVTRLLFVTISLGAIALYLTHSISAWLAFASGILTLSICPYLKNWSRVVLVASLAAFLLTPFAITQFTRLEPTNESFVRREYLNQAAWKMFLGSPFLGVGLNNFTARVEEYTVNREVVRFIQPVHHVGLLWLAETGSVGIVLVLLLIKVGGLNTFKSSLLALLPLLVLDHYVLTNQTGLLLLTFFTVTTSIVPIMAVSSASPTQ